VNTGNGGTGARAGGSGIVVIRYADSYAAAVTTGSPTVVVSGGYRTYTWTTSGSIAFFTSDYSLSLAGTNSGIIDATMKNNLLTVGDAKLSTAVVKYGTSSMYFDGTGDYLSIPASTNFVLNGDFTIEAWIYPTNVTGTFNLVALGSEATGRYVIYIVNGVLTSNLYGSGVVSMGGTISINTWAHIAVVRAGSTIKGYINGTVLGTTDANSSSLGNLNPIKIGSDASGAAVYVGYIDDLRITKGVARYTTTFTPPTAAAVQ
jgi:Concanavalin A-like lectin/glucanases superfamily